MKKQKFIRADIIKILTAAGMETEQARELTAQIIEAIAAALAAGKVVELRGLGTLEPRTRKARTRYNPRNKIPVNVPARRVIFFKPSGKLKKAINGQGDQDV
jgi:integration host factor subunit beta